MGAKEPLRRSRSSHYLCHPLSFDFTTSPKQQLREVVKILLPRRFNVLSGKTADFQTCLPCAL
jgi:hypothetical protein